MPFTIKKITKDLQKDVVAYYYYFVFCKEEVVKIDACVECVGA